MENKPEIIFINGLAPKLVSNKAPDFVRAEFGIHVDNMIQWLSDNRGLANENGYINGQFLKSKTKPGLYAAVNTYKPANKERTYQPEDFPIATSDHVDSEMYDTTVPPMPSYPDGTPF